MGFVNDSVQLFLGELRSVDVVGGREHSAGSANFDHVRAVFVVKADGIASLIRAVDHAFEWSGFVAKDSLAKPGLIIAVTTGGPEGVDCDKHAGARNIAVGDRIAKADVEIVYGTNVTNSREAGHESDACVNAGVEGAFCYCLLQVFQLRLVVIVGVSKREMSVGVDEAGENRGIAQIDDLGSRGDGCAGANGNNACGGYDDEARRNQRVALAIEKSGRLEDIRFARRILSLTVTLHPENYSEKKHPEDSCTHGPFRKTVDV